MQLMQIKEPKQELRQQALNIIINNNVEQKCQKTIELYNDFKENKISINTSINLNTENIKVGRPEKPELLPPAEVPRRSPATKKGRAALIHAICHIEFNAINLALDAISRFNNMPEEYYKNWLQVAYEEAGHFNMLHNHLQNELEHKYGDFEAHDGLWEMCEKTKNNIIARMALVPRTLEARGLDATPIIQQKLSSIKEEDAQKANQILNIILRDEIGHVAIGNHWYKWLCDKNNLNPVAHYKKLSEQYNAPHPKPPLNIEARKKAGFTQEEINELQKL